uniref:Uncharacterized protein MANES_08G137200 n=1 Tax=Rhizophora mucronata TaxID=61149 RepID=A0A2P2K7C5_RHIMU
MQTTSNLPKKHHNQILKHKTHSNYLVRRCKEHYKFLNIHTATLKSIQSPI